MFKVLIICADLVRLRTTRLHLERNGFYVRTATDKLRALEIMRSERPDIVVLSTNVPMVVVGVPAVVRMLDDPERMLKAVQWAARQVSGLTEVPW